MPLFLSALSDFSRLRFAAAFALVLAGAAAFLSPASAQQPAAPTESGESEQVRYLTAIEQLISARQYDRAEQAIVKSRFVGEEAAFRAAFLLAVIKARTGNYTDAEQRLRAILARRPDLERVQLELASVLNAQGRREAAAFQLRKLADAAGNEITRSELERLIDQIQPQGGFSANMFLTFAPSTNVNNGTQNTTILIGGVPFTIGKGSMAESGIGVTGGVSLTYARPLSENLTAFVGGSASYTDYSGKMYDKPVVELQAGLRYRGLKHFISAELLTDRVWIGGNPYSHGIGGRLTGRWNIAPKWLISADTTYITRFSDAAGGADADTWRTNIGLRFSPTVSSGYWIGGGFETETVKGRPFASYDEISGHLGHNRDLAFGLSASAHITVGTRRFNALFPGMADNRQDDFVEIRTSFLKRDFQIFGVTPRVGISYFNQKSNVPLHDYDRWSGNITLTREF